MYIYITQRRAQEGSGGPRDATGGHGMPRETTGGPREGYERVPGGAPAMFGSPRKVPGGPWEGTGGAPGGLTYLLIYLSNFLTYLTLFTTKSRK